MWAMFKTVFNNYFIQILVTGIFSIVAIVGKKMWQYYTNEIREQENIKNGLLALLRFRVNRLCNIIREQGYMTTDEKYDLVDLHTAYEVLGGNSRTHLMYEDTLARFLVKDVRNSLN